MTTQADQPQLCAHCGRFNRLSATFCSECGGALSYRGGSASDGTALGYERPLDSALTSEGGGVSPPQQSPPPPPPPAAAALLAARAASFRHIGPAASSGSPAAWEPGRIHEDAVFTASHLLSIDGASVPISFFALADGLSGEEAGNVASQAAVASVAERLLRGLLIPLLAGDAMPLPETIRHMVLEAIASANTDVRELCLSREIRASSTLTAGVLFGGRLTVGHVGDGRVYCVNDGTATVLTTDHTVAAEQTAAGMTPIEETVPETQWVTRAIGREPFVQVDIVEHGLIPGDMLIACTDGVWRPLGNDEVTKLVKPGMAPDEAAAAIVARAMAVFRPDDCTVVCVRVVGSAGGGVTTTVHSPLTDEPAVTSDTGDLPRLEDSAAGLKKDTDRTSPSSNVESAPVDTPVSPHRDVDDMPPEPVPQHPKEDLP